MCLKASPLKCRHLGTLRPVAPIVVQVPVEEPEPVDEPADEEEPIAEEKPKGRYRR